MSYVLPVVWLLVALLHGLAYRRNRKIENLICLCTAVIVSNVLIAGL